MRYKANTELLMIGSKFESMYENFNKLRKEVKELLDDKRTTDDDARKFAETVDRFWIQWEDFLEDLAETYGM